VISFELKTGSQQALIDVTQQAQRAVGQSGVEAGVCTLYVPHTTAALTVNEVADPAVREDVLEALRRLVPADLGYHHLEGNAQAHVQAALVGGSVQLPLEAGQLCLGTWQAIFFCEFDGPRTRQVWLSVVPGA